MQPVPPESARLRKRVSSSWIDSLLDEPIRVHLSSAQGFCGTLSKSSKLLPFLSDRLELRRGTWLKSTSSMV